MTLLCCLLAALAVSLWAHACDSSREAAAVTTLASGDQPTQPDNGRTVELVTEDGLRLSGRVFSPTSASTDETASSEESDSTDNWVILCHMYPADQASWAATARRLAEASCTVLTFDFRGYGNSQGTKDIQYLDRDVMAAVRFAQGSGATQVVLVGASMGGTACLKAEVQLQAMSSVRVGGVATFSAPVEFQGLSAREAVPQLVVPLLFVAAEGDVGAEGARTLEQLSGGLGDLELLPGSDHGTDLFTGSQADQAWQSLLDFVQHSLSTGS